MNALSVSCGRRLRGPLSVVLSLVLVGVGLPAPLLASFPFLGADVGEGLRWESDGHRYVIDLSDLVANRTAVAEGSGSFTVTMVDEASGREHIAWTLTRTPDRLTSAFRVGSDRLSTSLPQPILDGDPVALGKTPAAELAINGRRIALDLEALDRIRASFLAGRPLPEAEAAELRDAALAFDDAAGFFRAFHDLNLAAIETFEEGESGGQMQGIACLAPCIACAGGLGVTVAAYLGVMASCASSVATGGVTLIACVASVLGFNSTMMLTVASCARCVDCAIEPDPGDEEGHDCPCAGEPNCNC